MCGRNMLLPLLCSSSNLRGKEMMILDVLIVKTFSVLSRMRWVVEASGATSSILSEQEKDPHREFSNLKVVGWDEISRGDAKTIVYLLVYHKFGIRIETRRSFTEFLTLSREVRKLTTCTELQPCRWTRNIPKRNCQLCQTRNSKRNTAD